jgi:prolyl-tRNA synthetase
LIAEDGSLQVDPASKLEEEIIVRPTSETIIWHMFKKWITSYRDLPLKVNQWANVVRWEMRTRLFLRTSEFLWQEGHTAHATKEEAMQETLDIVEVYRTLFEEYLAIPTIIGRKSNLERFAGADETFSIETMMRDKKALQAGTSHYLGTNFGSAFDVKFQSRDNKELPVYATSWGVSTRMVGALIMVHGDDNGLKIPPKIAPIQVVIIPINAKKEKQQEFSDYINNVSDALSSINIRSKVDDSDGSPGFKFNKWELKGVPIRLEVGLKEFESSQITLCRRDNKEKQQLSFDSLKEVQEILVSIQSNMFNDAKSFMEENTCTAEDFNTFSEILSSDNKFIKAYWDGSDETELKIKDETKATIRCILEDVDDNTKKCIYSNKPAKHLVIFAKAY